jgi:hypothetical protein
VDQLIVEIRAEVIAMILRLVRPAESGRVTGEAHGARAPIPVDAPPGSLPADVVNILERAARGELLRGGCTSVPLEASDARTLRNWCRIKAHQLLSDQTTHTSGVAGLQLAAATIDEALRLAEDAERAAQTAR